MKCYELTPIDGRQSFYGKAFVSIMDDGSEILHSYNTPIIKHSIDGTLTRLYKGWTLTTGRHIKAFFGLNKAQFTTLPLQ